MYACWRFWEGITGQGSDDAFGKFKNFFKYRLSPLVSVSRISTACAHMFDSQLESLGPESLVQAAEYRQVNVVHQDVCHAVHHHLGCNSCMQHKTPLLPPQNFNKLLLSPCILQCLLPYEVCA